MNTVELKEGQTYVCKRDKLAWWTLDKEYKVQAFSNGLLYLTDDEGYNWYLPNDGLLNTVFKLKETQSNTETEKQKYTGFDVTKVIIRAHNMYDNDAQRLAYIKGYFAK